MTKIEFVMFLAGELARRCNYRHLPVTPTVRSPLGMTGETWATVKGVETARFASGDLSLTHFLTFLSKYSKQCHFSGPEAGFFVLPDHNGFHKRWRTNMLHCWSWSMIVSIRKELLWSLRGGMVMFCNKRCEWFAMKVIPGHLNVHRDIDG